MTLRERAAMVLLHGFKSALRPYSLVYGVGSPVWTAWNYRAYAAEGYQGNPYVYRAIQQVAQGGAGIKVWPKIRRGTDLIDIPSKHPVAKLIATPNERQGWPDLLEEQVATYLLGGMSYLLGVGPGAGRPPLELWPLGPNVMQAVPGKAMGKIDKFILTTANGRQELLPAEVFWFKSWNPLSSFDGVPALAPAAKSVDCNNAALAHNKALLDNGCVPGLVLSTDTTIPTAQRTELKAQIQERRSGSKNAGKFLLLEGGLKPTSVGFSPKDMMLESLVTSTAREVALVFGVPPELLGDASQKTFSNYREARAALYTETILPLLDRYYGSLAGWLSKQFGDEIAFAVDLDDIEALNTIRAEKWTRITAAFNAGLLTLDQALEEMGFDTVGGAEGAARRTQPSTFQITQGGKSWRGHSHTKPFGY